MVTKIDSDSTDLPVSHASALASAFLEYASEAVVAVDESQTIVAFGGGAERMFGYTAEEVINQPLALILPPGAVAVGNQEPAHLVKRRRPDQNLNPGFVEPQGTTKGGRQLRHPPRVSPGLLA